MGVAAGEAVGVAVGFGVGVAVGFAEAVGVVVGATVGVAVGTAVGVAVATLVGVTVGTAVGVAVAAGVDVAVATAVGVAVGSAVGVAVGATVGAAVGVGVGVVTGLRNAVDGRLVEPLHAESSNALLRRAAPKHFIQPFLIDEQCLGEIACRSKTSSAPNGHIVPVGARNGHVGKPYLARYPRPLGLPGCFACARDNGVIVVK